MVIGLQIFIATTTKEALLKAVQPHMINGGSSKVTIVGTGQVGMACAFSILSQVKYLIWFCCGSLYDIFYTSNVPTDYFVIRITCFFFFCILNDL